MDIRIDYVCRYVQGGEFICKLMGHSPTGNARFSGLLSELGYWTREICEHDTAPEYKFSAISNFKVVAAAIFQDTGEDRSLLATLEDGEWCFAAPWHTVESVTARLAKAVRNG